MKTESCFSAHINMRDMLLSEAEPIYHQVEEIWLKSTAFATGRRKPKMRGRGEEKRILNEDSISNFKRQNEE